MAIPISKKKVSDIKNCALKSRVQKKVKKYALLKQKRRIQTEKVLYYFVLDAFHALYPGEKFKTNWHIKYLCLELQAEIQRIVKREPKVKDLIINVPPRSLKSFIVTVCLPVWAWLQDPSLKFIGASYSALLSIEHNLLSRRIIESDWFQDMWGHKFHIRQDQNTKSKFENNMAGMRRATSTGGTITGSGADVIMLDDPQNPKLAESEVERKNVIDFYDLTLSTRLNNPEIGLFIIIMQRLHENDLTGYLLKKSLDKYKHICIPAEECILVKPDEIRKHYVEGLFFPDRFTADFLEAQKVRMGSYAYAGQMLQTPAPLDGGIFKENKWKYYQTLPKVIDVWIQSWDCAFKDKKMNSRVSGQVWAKRGPNFYLVACVVGHMGFIKTLEAIVYLMEKYPQAIKILVEDKANGTAVMETLKKKFYGIIPVEPEGGKLARAHAISPIQESGNIFLPCITDPLEFNTGDSVIKPMVDPWVQEFRLEASSFPNSEFNDQTDAFSQAINNLKGLTNPREDVNNIRVGKSLGFDL